MIKIVVGGQISKDEIAKFITNFMGDKAEVTVKNDLDAAMAMKAGQFDYYVGACNTGGGGALAMAMALVGSDKCATISMPGNICSDEFMIAEVKKGKTCFGFTAQHAEQVLPVVLQQMLLEKGE